VNVPEEKTGENGSGKHAHGRTSTLRFERWRLRVLARVLKAASNQ